MTRRSRTFKLHLSPAGMDLLIEAHCHLIRQTRQLLAWGTTLQLAVFHLETIPAPRIVRQLHDLATAGLTGREKVFLGAPRGVNEIAAGIAERAGGKDAMPTISSIYLVALREALLAEPDALLSALDRAGRRSRLEAVRPALQLD